MSRKHNDEKQKTDPSYCLEDLEVNGFQEKQSKVLLNVLCTIRQR